MQLSPYVRISGLIVTSWLCQVALAQSDGAIVESPGGINFGVRLGIMADINGDGVDDLLLGDSDAANDSGEAYVVFGQPGGLPTPFDVSSLQPANGGDGTDGVVLNGFRQGNGTSAAMVTGDVNGTGSRIRSSERPGAPVVAA